VPAIDLPTLKQQIATRRLAPVYVLLGEDVKLVSRMVEGIEGTVDPADRPFAVERMYAGEEGASPLDIASAARILPMLGDRRIVIVLRAERLLKPKRAGKSAGADQDDEETAEPGDPLDVTPLEEYLEAPASSACLVFVATEIDRGRRLTKRLVAKAVLVEFGGLPAGGGSGPSGTEGWLKAEIERSGRTIEARAVRLLVARAGHDITKLRGDVERLLLFTEGRRQISADDVMEVVTADTSPDDDWAVTNAIANGDPARALAETGRRLDHGDSPHQLVGQLRWWVSNRLVQGDPSRVKPALDALLRTDLALKSSGGEDRVLLERLVVELTGRPLPSNRGGGWR
jgi:DNA polymerase III delta subunit